MLNIIVLLVLVLAVASPLVAAPTFQEGYADAVWSNLTGFSSYQRYTTGVRRGSTDYYLSLKNEWYSTKGTNLPFQYSARGTDVGVGLRYWFPGRYLSGAVSLAHGVAGANEGQSDFRAGLVGYRQWEHQRRVNEVYGELTWVERADDLFLSVRARPGLVLNQTASGRLWAYGVGQVWASGQGENGTENRVEAGVGLGYLYRGQYTANLELRAGHSFSGTITERDYFNPMVIVAGNF
jgi:hypothetical protein